MHTRQCCCGVQPVHGAGNLDPGPAVHHCVAGYPPLRRHGWPASCPLVAIGHQTWRLHMHYRTWRLVVLVSSRCDVACVCVGSAGDGVWERWAGEGLDFERDTWTSRLCIHQAVVRSLIHKRKWHRQTRRYRQLTDRRAEAFTDIHWTNITDRQLLRYTLS